MIKLIENNKHDCTIFHVHHRLITSYFYLQSLDSRLYTLPRGNRLQATPENSPLNARRRLSQSDSFTGSPSLLTPVASPMPGRRLQSVSDPQPLLRLVIQGLVKKVCVYDCVGVYVCVCICLCVCVYVRTSLITYCV